LIQSRAGFAKKKKGEDRKSESQCPFFFPGRYQSRPEGGGEEKRGESQKRYRGGNVKKLMLQKLSTDNTRGADKERGSRKKTSQIKKIKVPKKGKKP